MDIGVGSSIIVKEGYDVHLNFGNAGLIIGGGSKGVVISSNKLDYVVGFKINDSITVTAKVYRFHITETEDITF